MPKWSHDEVNALISYRRKGYSWGEIVIKMQLDGFPRRTMKACEGKHNNYTRENQIQRRKRTRGRINQHCTPQVAALWPIIKERDLTWAELSRKSGVGTHTLKDWFYRAVSPRIDMLNAVYAALDWRLTPERIKLGDKK